MDMESMQRIIKQLTNEIIDLKKNKGEGNKPLQPFLKKKTNMDSSPQIPPSSGINLEAYSMENYCRTHHANHSKTTFPEFINSFTTMLLPQEPPKKESKNEKEDDDDEKQEEEEEPLSHLNMIQDEAEFDDDDDIMEEACVGHDYNLHSKGSHKSNDSPCAVKTVAKKTTTTSSTTSKQTSIDKSSEKEKELTPNKSPINLDLTQKFLGDLKMDYDVVQDLKKMKANITVFELCKITQLREKL